MASSVKLAIFLAAWKNLYHGLAVVYDYPSHCTTVLPVHYLNSWLGFDFNPLLTKNSRARNMRRCYSFSEDYGLWWAHNTLGHFREAQHRFAEGEKEYLRRETNLTS